MDSEGQPVLLPFIGCFPHEFFFFAEIKIKKKFQIILILIMGCTCIFNVIYLPGSTLLGYTNFSQNNDTFVYSSHLDHLYFFP